MSLGENSNFKNDSKFVAHDNIDEDSIYLEDNGDLNSSDSSIFDEDSASELNSNTEDDYSDDINDNLDVIDFDNDDTFVLQGLYTGLIGRILNVSNEKSYISTLQKLVNILHNDNVESVFKELITIFGSEKSMICEQIAKKHQLVLLVLCDILSVSSNNIKYSDIIKSLLLTVTSDDREEFLDLQKFGTQLIVDWQQRHKRKLPYHLFIAYGVDKSLNDLSDSDDELTKSHTNESYSVQCNLNDDDLIDLPEGVVLTEKPYGGVYHIETSTEQNPLITKKTRVQDLFNKYFSEALINCNVYSFNSVQSQIFDDVYNHDYNILVCAPTGAGKTNVAITAILRTINKHFDAQQWLFNSSDFKIVYLSPLKALVAEQVKLFQKFFDQLSNATNGLINLKVTEMTGDQSTAESELIFYNMLICTPEKYDIMLRRSKERLSVSIVKLLIIDEIHMINGTRGPVIEAIVARTIMNRHSTRILALSATLPDHQEAADFLNISNELNPDTNNRRGLHVFDSSYRPIPLSCYFHYVDSSFSRAQMNDKFNEITVATVFETIASNVQCIVFCTSRKNAQDTAKLIVDRALAEMKLAAYFQFDLANSPTFLELQKTADKITDETLAVCIRNGVAFHHAGLDRSDRDVVESLFSHRKIFCICSTSTLAWGVNLPAQTVIVKDVVYFDTYESRLKSYEMLDILQMLGRAGRMNFDKSGRGVIIAPQNFSSFCLKTLTGSFHIESKLMPVLTDFVNSEVQMGYLRKLTDVTDCVKKTFLFQRMLKVPAAYGVDCSLQDDEDDSSQSCVDVVRQKCNDFIDDQVINALNKLDSYGMVKFDASTNFIMPLFLGELASKFYVKVSSVNWLMKRCISHMSTISLFAIVCKCPEFDVVFVSGSELESLKKLASHCPYPIANSVNSYEGKCSILAQCLLVKERIDDLFLLNQAMSIANVMIRLLCVVIAIAEEYDYYQLFSSALTLKKQLQQETLIVCNPLYFFTNLNAAEERLLDDIEFCYEDFCRLTTVDYLRSLGISSRVEQQLVPLLNTLPKITVEATGVPFGYNLILVECHIYVETESLSKLSSELFYCVVTDVNSSSILAMTSIRLFFNGSSYETNQQLMVTTNLKMQCLLNVMLLSRDIVFPEVQIVVELSNMQSIESKYTVTDTSEFTTSGFAKLEDLLADDIDAYGPVLQLLNLLYKNDQLSSYSFVKEMMNLTLQNDQSFVSLLPTPQYIDLMLQLSICNFLSQTRKPLIVVCVSTPTEGEYVHNLLSERFKPIKIVCNLLHEDIDYINLVVKCSHILVVPPRCLDLLMSRERFTKLFSRVSLILGYNVGNLMSECSFEMLVIWLRLKSEILGSRNRRVGLLGMFSISVDSLTKWLEIPKCNVLNIPFSSLKREITIKYNQNSLHNYDTLQFAEATSIFSNNSNIERSSAIDCLAFSSNVIVQAVERYLMLNGFSLESLNILQSLNINVDFGNCEVHIYSNKDLSALGNQTRYFIIIEYCDIIYLSNLPNVHLFCNYSFNLSNDFRATVYKTMNCIRVGGTLNLYATAYALKQMNLLIMYPCIIESSLLSSFTKVILLCLMFDFVDAQSFLDVLSTSYFAYRLSLNPSYYYLGQFDADSASMFLSSLIEKCLLKLQQMSLIEYDDNYEHITVKVRPDILTLLSLYDNISFSSLLETLSTLFTQSSSHLLLLQVILSSLLVSSKYLSLLSDYSTDYVSMLCDRLLSCLLNSGFFEAVDLLNYECQLSLPVRLAFLSLLQYCVGDSKSLEWSGFDFTFANCIAHEVQSLLNNCLSFGNDIIKLLSSSNSVAGNKFSVDSLIELSQLLNARGIPDYRYNELVQLPGIVNRSQVDEFVDQSIVCIDDLMNLSSDKLDIIFTKTRLDKNIVSQYINNMLNVDMTVELSRSDVSSVSVTVINLKKVSDISSSSRSDVNKDSLVYLVAKDSTTNACIGLQKMYVNRARKTVVIPLSDGCRSLQRLIVELHVAFAIGIDLQLAIDLSESTA